MIATSWAAVPRPPLLRVPLRSLEFAFTTAELHGARVHAVRALPLFRPHAVPGGHDAGRQDAEERTRLTAGLAPWREKFPDVPVVEQVTAGPAAQVLLSAGTHSQLTVVGRQRHPTRLTWKLGPVAHVALHHVPGPVAVVPPD
jgi:nucleotide-binding universal stress UspA family protein